MKEKQESKTSELRKKVPQDSQCPRSSGPFHTMSIEVFHKIDEELDSEDIAALKFLCRDLIPLKKLENVQDGRNLFMRLEEQGLLEHDDIIIKDLLLTIRRFDLLRLLGTNQNQVQNLLQSRKGSTSGISAYRKMLYKLSEDVTEDNLASIKFLLNIPRGRLELCTTFLDVLAEMEKQELLGENHLKELERVCSLSSKVLSVKLQQYVTGELKMQRKLFNYVSTHFHKATHNKQGQRPLPETCQNCKFGVQTMNEFGKPKGILTDISTPVISMYKLEEVYSMTHRPRGHCLVINNFNFGEARANMIDLRDRQGTDQDAKALNDVFSSLHFEVHLKKDLTAKKMQKVVKEFSQKDHSQRDAFVCCILSHGEKGSVHGTDGQLVPIRQVTLPFTCSQCPTLAQKPKLFFIQACQGKYMQRGVTIQADGEGDEQVEEQLFDIDAKCVVSEVTPETVPEDSDFLLGMATVEDYKSFRSIKEGSIFIQELCKQLRIGCRRKEDILTILTKVNLQVSSGVYLNRKQMPEPRYTLTKKLVLPLD
ncbi:caspase-8-like [Arapaima gigas]